jgi:hypothetical protein
MKAQKRLLISLVVLLLLTLNVTPISAQTKKKSTKSAPSKLPIAAVPQSVDDKEATATVDRLLVQSGQKFTRGDFGIWILRRTGPSLPAFTITLSQRGGTLVAQVNVAKKTYFKLHDAAPTLLSLAYRLDYAKVSLDSEGDVWVRNEARIKSLDLDELTNNLDRVAAAADQVFAELNKNFKIR